MALMSFVVPVYRNQGTVRSTCDQIREMMGLSFPETGYQIVLVDDGSDDGSLQEMIKLREEDPAIEAISLSRNFGQVAGDCVAGLRQAAW